MMKNPFGCLSRRHLLQGMACIGAGALLPRPATAAPGAAFTLNEIADGVHVFTGATETMTAHNQGAICNLGIVVGNEAVAVIDSGGSIAEAQAFLSAIRGITDKPIRYLVNTHMHPDHIFGNAVFRDAGATIVGHRNLPPALAARAEFYLRSYRNQIGAQLMEGVEIIVPTLLVDDLLELDLGGRTVELRAWRPAHTDNDLTLLDKATATLFAGDLVFLQHLPTLDGSLLGWLGQMDELAAMEALRVVPGHGTAPADWPAALDPQRRYFEALARDLRKAIKDGTPLAQAVVGAAESTRGEWRLFDEYNERNATAAYAELEWE